MMVSHTADRLFKNHDRDFGSFRYVYPVVSRRSGGLSVGINLNVDGICNFDCIYCQVDRSDKPMSATVDLAELHDELDAMIRFVKSGKIWQTKPFDQTPQKMRRLNDIAFSGNGEPTAYPKFGHAMRLVVDLKAEHELDQVKLVLITNGSLLLRPKVCLALTLLDQNQGEVWAKLDVGCDQDYQRISRSPISFQRIVTNLIECGRTRPIVIQTMSMRIEDQPPSDEHMDAYIRRLGMLIEQGCQIKQLQMYTVARKTAESYVTYLTHEQLDHFADRVRAEVPGLPVEVYYGA